jgi:hypothetical protein
MEEALLTNLEDFNLSQIDNYPNNLDIILNCFQSP